MSNDSKNTISANNFEKCDTKHEKSNSQSGGRFRLSFRQKKKRTDSRDKKANENDKDQAWPKLLSQEEAQLLVDELVTEYSFSPDQIIELQGYSCAMVISKVYPKDTLYKNDGSMLICCGPGTNGAQALVCARHLKLFGYKPTVFYPMTPTKSLYKNLVNQCEKMDIPFLSYMPSTTHLLDSSYNIIVDGVLGFNFMPPLRQELADVMAKLKQVKIPIVSIDIPSGWDVESGDSEGIQPDTLISLISPKLCVRYFHGRCHFLAGRFLPPSLVTKYQLNLPKFAGTECCVALQISESDHNDQNDGSN